MAIGHDITCNIIEDIRGDISFHINFGSGIFTADSGYGISSSFLSLFLPSPDFFSAEALSARHFATGTFSAAC